MKHNMIDRNDNGENGAALIIALLMTALLLALTMGMSMTAVSELGVTNTYANQTQAFQAAEAGIYHAVNLTRNYIGTGPSSAGFTDLLASGTVSITISPATTLRTLQGLRPLRMITDDDPTATPTQRQRCFRQSGRGAWRVLQRPMVMTKIKQHRRGQGSKFQSDDRLGGCQRNHRYKQPRGRVFDRQVR
jgi:Tfp pilus assembly protein PilX